MTDITIKLKNHSFLQVISDDGIAREIWDYFSFFVPNYKFMPSFRNKMWDGKIRLFNLKSRELPAGLYSLLTKFCQSRKYSLDTEGTEFGTPDQKQSITRVEIEEFIEGLNLSSRGKSISPRDYQFEAIYSALKNKRLILQSPTGSGKSLIIYVLMRYLLTITDLKILIIVPTLSLVEQMYTDFEDYASFDSWDVSLECHRIYSGKPKMNIHERVFISTWQSIYKLSTTWFSQFGVVFGDEAHGFKATSLTSIMNKSYNAEYRFGTTGTLDGSQVNELVLQGVFGPVKKVTTTKKLQDKGTLAHLELKMIILKYPEEVRKIFGKQKYQSEIAFIVGYEPRNKYIKNLAKSLNGNTLILFQFVEKHGKILYQMIKNSCPARKVFYVSGETDKSDRELIRKIVETQKNAIIVASSGVFSTGINIRNLHNIIFSSPSKSQIRVLQSIGRGLRKSDNGVHTRLFDLCDNISWKKQVNYALKHADDRMKIYKQEEFDVKIYKVDLK